MSWGMVAVGVGTAVAGAVSSNQQAKAANKSKTSHTNQTTTSRPYLADELEPDIGNIINSQRALYQQGSPGYAAPQYATYGPGGGGGGGAPAKGKKADGTGQPKNPKNRGKAAPAGAAAPAAGPSTPQGARGILGEAARRGFEAGDSPLVNMGRDAVGKVLDTSGATGFEGYNPLAADLAGRYDGASFDRGVNLLENFLGESGRGSSGKGAGGAGGGGGGSKYGPRAAGMSGGGGGYGAGGGVVPDATGDGLFGQEVRKIFADDGSEDSPGMQALIKKMTDDALKGHYASLADLDANSQGTGRLGGGTWAALREGANEEFDDELQGNVGGLRYQNFQDARGARLNALGQVNARDLGAMSDRTQRAGIDASSAATSAGAASAAELAKRGQDLDAIQLFLGHDRAGLDGLGQLAGQRSQDYFNGLAGVGDIEGIGLSGLDRAISAGGNLGQMDVGMAGVNAQRSAANQALNFQKLQYNNSLPQMQLDSYLNTVLRLGGMGGTSTTVGTNVVPGAGISTGGATAAGALGGAAAGLGAYYAGRG